MNPGIPRTQGSAADSAQALVPQELRSTGFRRALRDIASLPPGSLAVTRGVPKESGPRLGQRSSFGFEAQLSAADNDLSVAATHRSFRS